MTTHQNSTHQNYQNETIQMNSHSIRIGSDTGKLVLDYLWKRLFMHLQQMAFENDSEKMHEL